MLIINSNGSKWYGQEPDGIPELLKALKKYTLDPSFEKYGNFVDHNPKYIGKKTQEKLNGCTRFFGNFIDRSHVFSIDTDDETIINELEAAIQQNKQTEAYQKARQEIYS